MTIEELITQISNGYKDKKWSRKRIESIIREAERLGIQIEAGDVYSGNNVCAKWKDLPLIGSIEVERRGYCRPRIAMRLWVKGKSGQGFNDRVMLCYDGKEMYSYRNFKGGEALEIVFGRARMMVYNRLMPALINCSGRV